MSASTIGAGPSASPRIPFRLARAELLKLRKRRGLVIPAALLTVGAVILMYVIIEIFHLANAQKHGPAGGVENFRHAVLIMGQLAGMVAAVLVGTFAATADLDSGVFRELVATGRSRTHLFLARIPGGLALLWSLVGAAFLLAVLFTVGLAGVNPTPSAGLLLKAGLWVEMSAGLVFLLALGVGSLLGSRAATISVLLAWLLVVQPILRSIRVFGVGREALGTVAVDRLSPTAVGDQADRIGMSLATAILVILAWAVIPLVAGLWRTQTRDA